MQFCKAGSGSALRKTAGSGSAKKGCGSTALLGAFYIAQSNIYLSFLQLSSKRTKYPLFTTFIPRCKTALISCRKVCRIPVRQASRSMCPHRRHHRLENLRTLILADNLLREISLHTTTQVEQTKGGMGGEGTCGNAGKFLFILFSFSLRVTAAS